MNGADVPPGGLRGKLPGSVVPHRHGSCLQGRDHEMRQNLYELDFIVVAVRDHEMRQHLYGLDFIVVAVRAIFSGKHNGDLCARQSYRSVQRTTEERIDMYIESLLLMTRERATNQQPNPYRVKVAQI